MPIDFQFKGLQIRDFRGLQSVDVDFPKNALKVLIGANNSGKSTILDAISFVLEGPSFYNYTLEKYDYHSASDGTRAEQFEVKMLFSAATETSLPAVRGAYGDPMPVYGACVTGSIEKNERYSHKTRLIDQHGKPILIPSALPLKGKAKEDWKDHKLSFSQRYARWSDISDHKPEVWLLKPGNLFVSLYQWKTGPLQRLAKLLTREFFDAKWDFDYKGKKHPMPEALHKVHEFFASAMHEFPFWRDDMKPKLEETLSLYVGRQARFDLKPDINSIEEWLAEQLAFSFAADAGGVTTPLEKMGDGWQSLVRIAALDVLSQYPKEIASHVVLLFEEPESFLHPHLARKLRGVLERLASTGWTVVLTTHSPNFVNFSGSQSIVRLTRNANAVKACVLETSQVEEAPKFQERIDERGAHEMLFAQKAVLVEGQDDVFALRPYLQKRVDLDLDGRSISIIRAGDVGQLPAFASMASKLGIPWCAVSDEDLQPDGTIKKPTAIAREKLTKLQKPCDRQTTWKQALEACLKKTSGKADADWQAQHIETKSTADLKAENPDYVAACEEVHTWILEPLEPPKRSPETAAGKA
jgi:ABC-type polar amino acid transport system ATPase subunit